MSQERAIAQIKNYYKLVFFSKVQGQKYQYLMCLPLSLMTDCRRRVIDMMMLEITTCEIVSC